jgi:hypothetical protein
MDGTIDRDIGSSTHFGHLTVDREGIPEIRETETGTDRQEGLVRGE